MSRGELQVCFKSASSHGTKRIYPLSDVRVTFRRLQCTISHLRGRLALLLLQPEPRIERGWPGRLVKYLEHSCHPSSGRTEHHDISQKVSRSPVYFVQATDHSQLRMQSGRLGWGGAQASDLMLKLMQLKYPTFPGRLTPYQAGVSAHQPR